MRAVQRAADKVCCSVEEKQTFMKLGSLIMAEENAETVQQIFATMAGEQTLKLLPKRLQQLLPTTQLNTTAWKAAKSWASWWMRPMHLSMFLATVAKYMYRVYAAGLGIDTIHTFLTEMLTPAHSAMSINQWLSMPRDTNGVEALNKCSIDHSHRSKTLHSCVEFTYRQDKKATFEHLYAYSGLPISFRKKTVDTMRQRAARQNKARYRPKPADDDDIGLKGRVTNIVQHVILLTVC